MRDTEIIDGIACTRVEADVIQGIQKRQGRWARIPLPWLMDLPGECGKIKVIAVLWFLDAVTSGEWFSLSGKICRKYGISAGQRFKILASLERSGHVELQRAPGKSTKIQLIKPRGWR